MSDFNGFSAPVTSDFFPSQGQITYYDLDYRRFGVIPGVLPFGKEDVPANFPMSQWEWQARRYLEYWRMFTGAVWQEQLPDIRDERGNVVYRYPLQINYIKQFAQKAAYVLFGEASDTPDPLVRIEARPRNKPNRKQPTDEEKSIAQEAEDFVNRVWMENNGRSLQLENGTIQQFIGGCYFKINWCPDDRDLENQIRIESVIPDFVLPVWDVGRPDRLLECYIIYRIQGREAEIRFNLEGQAGDYPLYIEHWTPKFIDIRINNMPINFTAAGHKITYDHLKNPFGRVPIFYIPRERAGSFYGISQCDDIIGLARESNARLADIGELIKDNIHRDYFARNVTSSPKPLDLGMERPAINLGVSSPATKQLPEIWTIDPPNLGQHPDWYERILRGLMRDDAGFSGVAFGEDQGGERSAKTLAARMWPTTAKMRAVRTYWSTAMVAMAKQIIEIAIEKGIGGMTEKHLKTVDFNASWFPMMPKDEEQQVDRAVALVQTGIMSPQTAIEVLDVSDDPDAEYDAIVAARAAITQAGAMTDASSDATRVNRVGPESVSVDSSQAPVQFPKDG
jgi:hypothetical protein